ncbi:MAG: PVC-type heme-binding CxxCH protein, partial [Verrucomicrobiota bacterium]
MRSRSILFLSCVFLPLAGQAEPVADLLSGPLEEGFAQHLNEDASLETAFPGVWQRTADSHLRITGKGLGYLRTKDTFENYHLVVEYRWTEHTYAGRADRARDGGVLFHISGSDGAFGGTWPACLQAQLIEGGSGDLVCLPTEETPTGFQSNASLQDLPIWTADADLHSFPLTGKKTGHLGWKDRSENWSDTKGFRGELDIENPVGEWNRLEVIAVDDTVEIHLNGEVVNRATGVFPTKGAIGFQTEFASYEIRRAELFAPGDFTESWADRERSTDMGYDIAGESILPRESPLTPEESKAAWQIDGDFEIELVAHEPLTCDPVDIAWDEKGRLFVAEMGDYPLPRDGTPYLSRIRLLSDENNDGVMDAAVTWADELDHVQGLLPMKGGLLATTRTAILFLQDTDADDKADVREVLFRSNEPRHNQLQVSSPRYGLDNHIYFSNGLDGKEIYPESDPDSVVSFPRLNLRYDPKTGEIRPSSGIGQFGGTLDAFGRHYFCSNRNPVMFAVMPLEVVNRNPLAGITTGHEDIQESAAPLHPLQLSHTTSSAHAGTHTSACGICVYTGDLLPSLTDNVFVCDPTGQLVTRNRLVENGSSFVAERVGDGVEFLASADEWTRPVQVRNGPDGALYIVDMYRRFIDHARFFPEEFSKSHYMRAGVDQGRIWRIVPKGTKAEPATPLPDDSSSLVEELRSPNGWRRIHAHRLLVEGKKTDAVPDLLALLQSDAPPPATAHAFRILQALDQLTPEVLTSIQTDDAGVLENRLLAARELGWSDEIMELLLKARNSKHPRVRSLSIALFPDADPPVEL